MTPWDKLDAAHDVARRLHRASVRVGLRYRHEKTAQAQALEILHAAQALVMAEASLAFAASGARYIEERQEGDR